MLSTPTTPASFTPGRSLEFGSSSTRANSSAKIPPVNEITVACIEPKVAAYLSHEGLFTLKVGLRSSLPKFLCFRCLIDCLIYVIQNAKSVHYIGETEYLKFNGLQFIFFFLSNS